MWPELRRQRRIDRAERRYYWLWVGAITHSRNAVHAVDVQECDLVVDLGLFVGG